MAAKFVRADDEELAKQTLLDEDVGLLDETSLAQLRIDFAILQNRIQATQNNLKEKVKKDKRLKRIYLGLGITFGFVLVGGVIITGVAGAVAAVFTCGLAVPAAGALIGVEVVAGVAAAATTVTVLGAGAVLTSSGVVTTATIAYKALGKADAVAKETEGLMAGLETTNNAVDYNVHNLINTVQEAKQIMDFSFDVTLPSSDRNKKLKVELMWKKIFAYLKDKQLRKQTKLGIKQAHCIQKACHRSPRLCQKQGKGGA